MHRENDKRHLFRDARVAIGEKRETRKKKKRKEIIHIYMYRRSTNIRVHTFIKTLNFRHKKKREIYSFCSPHILNDVNDTTKELFRWSFAHAVFPCVRVCVCVCRQEAVVVILTRRDEEDEED